MPPKKPRRPEGHPAAVPARGNGVGFEQPLPRAKSCQWAYLVAMHRAESKAGLTLTLTLTPNPNP